MDVKIAAAVILVIMTTSATILMDDGAELPELPINTTFFNLTDGMYQFTYTEINGTVRMIVVVRHISDDVVEVSFGGKNVTYRK